MIFNETLHPEMLKTLESAPADRGVVMLLRHSTRHLIPPGSQGVDIPLTSEGIKLAEELGSLLKLKISCIMSSPSGRCIETGKAILRGAKMKCDVICEPLLGEPGAFVVDVKKASPWFLQYDPLPMINRQLQCKHIPGVRQINEGVELILKLIFTSLPKPGEIGIFITHDSVMACVIYYLGKIKCINADMWPWMLEGCCFWKNNSHLLWSWRGGIRFLRYYNLKLK